MNIKYGDLNITIDKEDMDGIKDLKNSLTTGDKIMLIIGGLTITIAVLTTSAMITIKTLENK